MTALQHTMCEQCPWRRANHGKRHPSGFYRKTNLRRLWNQIRNGGGVQSCHLTDVSHLDHVKAGAREGSVKECFGSVVLITRELNRLQRIAKFSGSDVVTPEAIDQYLLETRQSAGLKRKGLLYYILSRVVFARMPGEGPPLPDVGEAANDPEIARLPV